ncbi:major facilitator superfamily domain-containing protein [Cercophora scortea]|uniref:Major facilitator superfamily domain-containing protein n=1 Tax=Cercophora scortea TaxID=314031 RepID=A0AAE0IG59_9PEZI|nr:major facilitator superfamily domain-containing protein [Cercophora scortea]
MSRDLQVPASPVGMPDERTSLLRSHSLSIQSSGPVEPAGHDEENVVDGGGELSPTSTVGSQNGLRGVFLVNADSAILLALFRQIASDFDHLSSASWIISSYIIGVIVMQPLYGKLSNIYGRKPLLLFAYACYCVGGLLAGLGFSFWGILAGRALCGVGNAGITVLISVLILDLVPIREVAVWRGYVYAVNQAGRAVGPSLGGFIAESSNWRWALLYQVPLTALGLGFIWWKMSFPTPLHGLDELERESCQQSKLKRIDFSGSISLGLANVSLLLFLDRVQRSPKDLLNSLSAIFPLSTWVALLLVFIAVESFWAREPILPLRLLARRNVVSAYSIQFLQTAAQMALYTSIPLYFRVTMGDSGTVLGVRLMFITLGTIAGGLISGIVIKRQVALTGLYRCLTVVSIVVSNLSFLTIFLRWRGATGWAETTYGFPIGLGFGVSLSAAFIGLAAGIDSSELACSTSGFYLSLNLGSLIGVSGASLLIGAFVEHTLQKRLQDMPDAAKIIHDVTSNFDSINELPGYIAKIVLEAYTQSFVNVWLFSLVFGTLALVASLAMREGQLKADSSANKRRSSSLHSRDYSTFPRRPNTMDR